MWKKDVFFLIYSTSDLKYRLKILTFDFKQNLNICFAFQAELFFH